MTPTKTHKRSRDTPRAQRTLRLDPLRDQLRAGDPLPPGDELSSLQAIRMRNAMLAESRHHAPRRGWRLAAIAAVLSATLGSVYLLRLVPDTTVDDGLVIAATGPSGAGASSAASWADDSNDRQIQFITRGGTRVIWLLKPKLDLEPQ